MTVTTRSFNGVATYSCNTGYTLSGSATRSCLSSGTWSGSAPICTTSKLPHNELITPLNCSIILSQVEFRLGGRTFPNNSAVEITDIGDFETGGDALLCVTDNTNCCSNPDGEFYYPDGTPVGFSSTNSIYRNRGPQVVRLNRRNGAISPLGRYRCDIPDATGTTRSVYIMINSGGKLCFIFFTCYL